MVVNEAVCVCATHNDLMSQTHPHKHSVSKCARGQRLLLLQ